MRGREVEGIVENLDLVFHRLFLLLDVVDGAFEILVKVADGEQLVFVLFVADAEEAHQRLRQPCGEERNGVEDGVDGHHGEGEEFDRGIGVDAEHRFGDELAHEQDDAGGYQSLDDEDQELTHARFVERFFEEFGKSHTVDNEGYVVANQDCGDEKFGVAVEYVERAAYRSAHFDVELGADAVGGDVGDFHTGE